MNTQLLPMKHLICKMVKITLYKLMIILYYRLIGILDLFMVQAVVVRVHYLKKNLDIQIQNLLGITLYPLLVILVK